MWWVTVQAFRWLSETLGPGFGPENWTSERHGLVPGFTHYEGSSITKFRCPDDNGALTALWYGEDEEPPAWPMYHIEVKSTLHRGMFHMTQQQLRTVRPLGNMRNTRRSAHPTASQALSLTTRPKDSDSPPSEVYVVVCTSGIHDARPEHEVFIDPYRLIYEGQLVIASGDTLLVSAS
ncbi:hypothetical protein DAEQUDRAFT_390210 [Daedalea quercina L-15889]|uniref:Uncharacterized protein n=1 Tax=Daedalea quercina L-15889 TaxID=1314783 RepID=A0A165NUK8_9APHY|nr:hypothetical protein DAEQUDRAFT_390210 [Daedalea quercina L-15889]